MTTCEPGASDVFTHGLRSSPRSTAFFASSAAPIITDGLEVFVHDVIDAMTTDPWSTSVATPSTVTGTGLDGRGELDAGASDAGKDSSSASSTSET